MGNRALPRFFLRTVMIVTTWVAGAAFAAHVPDVAAERRAEELAPVVPFMNQGPDHPQNPPTNLRPETHSGSRPSEAPPLIEPPSPTPA
jgi:hypothetical protein